MQPKTNSHAEKTNLLRKMLKDRIKHGDSPSDKLSITHNESHNKQKQIADSDDNLLSDEDWNVLNYSDESANNIHIDKPNQNNNIKINNESKNKKEKHESKTIINNVYVNCDKNTSENVLKKPENQLQQPTHMKKIETSDSNSKVIHIKADDIKENERVLHSLMTNNSAPHVLSPTIQNMSAPATITNPIQTMLPHYSSNIRNVSTGSIPGYTIATPNTMDLTTVMSGNILAGTLMPNIPTYNTINNQLQQPFTSSPQVYNNYNQFVPINDAMQYEQKHNYEENNCILSPPTTLEDYYWICYHFRSDNPSACLNGSDCQWRHYDFEMRMDVSTRFNIEIMQQYKPTVKQLEQAKKLKQQMEQSFPWLVNDTELVGNKGDIQRIISLLAPFEDGRNSRFDYYALGKLAINELRSMQNK
eukprot:262960_1